MPAPINNEPPTLEINTTSWTGTVGSWSENGGGSISYAWELRLIEDDSVEESGSGTSPSGTGTYNNTNGYYLSVDATNTGGTTEARSDLDTLGDELGVWFCPTLDYDNYGSTSTISNFANGTKNITLSSAISSNWVNDTTDGGEKYYVGTFTNTNIENPCEAEFDCTDGVTGEDQISIAWWHRGNGSSVLYPGGRENPTNNRWDIGYIVSVQSTQTIFDLYVLNPNGSLQFSQYQYTLSTTNMSATYHIAVLFDASASTGNQARLFVDDQEQTLAHIAVGGGYTASSFASGGLWKFGNITAGGFYVDTERHFSFDNWRLYNRELFDSEINELYVKGRSYDHQSKWFGAFENTFFNNPLFNNEVHK